MVGVGPMRYDPARVDARERLIEEPRRYPSSVATSPDGPSRVPLHASSNRMTGSPEPSPESDSKSKRNDGKDLASGNGSILVCST